jgi:hypothetical protein
MEESWLQQDQSPPLPVDSNLAAEQQQAQTNLMSSLQGEAQGDTASLMARYGTRLAMAGANSGSPLVTVAPPTPASVIQGTMGNGGLGGLFGRAA